MSASCHKNPLANAANAAAASSGGGTASVASADVNRLFHRGQPAPRFLCLRHGLRWHQPLPTAVRHSQQAATVVRCGSKMTMVLMMIPCCVEAQGVPHMVVLGERQLLRRLVESDVDPAPPHRSLNGRHTPCHRKPSQRSQAQVSAPKPRACSIPATGEGAHAPCWPGCRERRRRSGTAWCQEHTAWCPLAVAIWAEPAVCPACRSGGVGANSVSTRNSPPQNLRPIAAATGHLVPCLCPYDRDATDLRDVAPGKRRPGKCHLLRKRSHMGKATVALALGDPTTPGDRRSKAGRELVALGRPEEDHKAILDEHDKCKSGKCTHRYWVGHQYPEIASGNAGLCSSPTRR